MVGGLKTEEIARAFLVELADRRAADLAREEDAHRRSQAPFAVPEGEELDARLPDVLEVVYLIFNEGYAATQGEQWMRPALVEDALRLGRVLAGLAPRQAGGARARGADGAPGLAHARPPRARRPAGAADGPGPRGAGTCC